ncbi:hypothetical protein SDC9_192304 [bioreactor metagenome]|uniref:Uncharacterized protein n=1 Tax=bioreactor metagenome TaxID=1076179 RepID=A0A645I2U3_9ZZZZ
MQRLNQSAGHEGIVHDQNSAVAMGDIGYGLQIGNGDQRIGYGLRIQNRGVRLDIGFHRSNIRKINEGCLYTVLGKNIREYFDSLTIEGLIGKDMIPRFAVGNQRRGNGCHTAGAAQGLLAPFNVLHQFN